ncbi:guanylate kinase isoform X2 [Anabrus simplex]|uniref:guanylate kinase isoform X2 n=1 Tax=Anabrus simplex TaxID=316456 RepID=UPI0035A2CB15
MVFLTAVLRMVHRGSRVIVVCGPSGSGKSSLLRRLFDEFPDKFGFSVSHTTRKPRPGEEDGKHYHFTTKEAMEEAIKKGEFLESAIFSDNIYGTSKAAVEAVRQSGKVCVLDIEVQGVEQVKKTDLNPLYIFVKPPSLNALESRLRGRGTETEESLERRLNTAKEELEYGEKPGNFDFILVNDNLEKSYEQLRTFIMSELENKDSVSEDEQSSPSVNGTQRRQVPWWTEEIAAAIKERRRAHKKFRRNPTTTNRIMFKKMRAKARDLIRGSKNKCQVSTEKVGENGE